MELKDQAIIVTGGASGIGREACLALARMGAAIVVADFNAEGAAKVAEAVKALGVAAHSFKVDGSVASRGNFNYNAAKAAVIAMTRSGALELAEHGIRVVGIAPGYIDTPILGTDKGVKEQLAAQHMHRELIAPEKVASVAAYLFTDAAEAINGSTVPVDDGFLAFKE
ncbi:SDR family NAD(P)-dependent oxidoreductase [Novosphingobium profundi]|uniref:SDR family NAD(P)-dependent oxidoreductase n=1 Tax=Novosphingobium profundi TaxID=1774954 RepID=UPI001CFCD090|nr:SDR family oxidoreductase [Novosphingobium profundi]